MPFPDRYKPPLLRHDFVAGGSAANTLWSYTNQPVTADYWNGNNGRRNAGKMDLRLYSQFQVHFALGVTSAIVGARFYLVYRTDLSSIAPLPSPFVALDWPELGYSIPLALVPASLPIRSNWVDLPLAAKAEVCTVMVASEGGDGVEDPSISNMSIIFR